MGPLQGVRVLDLTRARSGPAAVRQLGDWGADVIRVELPASIEAEDTLGGGPRHGPDFQNIQRNKRGLSLNLKEPEGRAILLELARKADVLVENFRPDVKDRLGIGYDTLRDVNPRLIYASISGFGQDGPYALRPGFDQIAQGMGGMMSVTGEPGRGPMRAGVAIADMSAGVYCAFGILLALYEREKSGQGQWVTSSLLEAQIAMLDFQAARWLVSGEVPGQAGNDHPVEAPMGVYETQDGAMNLAVGGNMWARFCKTIDAPELLDDPRFVTKAKRGENRAAMNEILNRRFRLKPTSHWIQVLNDAGIPSGPIHSVDQVFQDPQVAHLGIVAPVEHPVLGRIALVGQPVHLSRTPSAVTQPAPEKGEHTRDILAELGYTADRIDDLIHRQIA